MRIFTCIGVLLVLCSCEGSPRFDATNQDTVQQSTQKIRDSLPEAKHDELSSAITYFSMGGEEGLMSMFGQVISQGEDFDAEKTIYSNLQKIHGSTGEEILARYTATIAEREAVSELKKDAEKLLESNEFEKALEKYESLRNYETGVAAAQAGLAETKEAMTSFAEKMAYIDNIELTEFVAKRIDTYSNKAVPAVRISLKNNGDRSLDKVKVVVYFQDAGGATIFEEDFHPVLVSQYSFGRNNKPLKPGYISEMETDKYYTIDSQLSTWAEGKAIAKVTDIKFSD